MGNLCSGLCGKIISFFTIRTPVAVSDNFFPESSQFSDKNNSKFMIPKDYLYIITQIKEKILIDETSLWPKYQIFLLNSKSYLTKLLNGLKSYKNLSVIDNIPFETIFQIEIMFPKKYPRKFILEIQKANFISNVKSPQIQGLRKPYIEIEIYPNEKKNPDRVIFFQTKVGAPINSPEWNEVFVYEFEPEEIKETGKFLISLYYIDANFPYSKTLIDKKYIFEFTEISNQRVNEKIIKLKEENNIIGEIFFRVQLIYNYEKFLIDWINELEVKLEIIERILKINAEFSDRPQKKVRLSTSKKKKFVEEKFIEMTNISKVSISPEINDSPKTKSPLFGMKPLSSLKLDDFESLDDATNDKSEYYQNNFIIK